MQKRSHKLRAMGDIKAVVSRSSSMSAAARALGVNRATVYRWAKAGKVPRPSSFRGEMTRAPSVPGQSPEEWAAAVRACEHFSETDQQLLALAVLALTEARNMSVQPSVRLAAMGRFQSLVRQMGIEPVTTAVVEHSTLPQTRRSPRHLPDPRLLVMPWFGKGRAG